MRTLNEELFDRLMRLPPRMRGLLFREHEHADRDRRHEDRRTRRYDYYRARRHDFPGRPGAPEGPEFRGHHGHGHHEEEPRGMTGRGAMLVRERVLGVLAGCEAGLRQKDIAEEIRVNPSSMSELIDKLENDGYVERTVDPSDRRATLILLTEKGHARACELEDSRNERLGAMFWNLTEDEKKELVRLLDKLMAGRGEDGQRRAV